MSEAEVYEQNPVAERRSAVSATAEKGTTEEAARILKPEIVEQKIGKRALGRSLSMVQPRKLTRLEAQQIAAAFPEADPGQLPSGNNILVQIAKQSKRTASGLLELPDEVVQHQEWNEQTARVIAHGPLAYRNPNTGEPYQEGNWCEPGDFVRIPKWGGDRSRDTDKQALFLICRDRDVICLVTGNPLTFRNRI